MNYYFFGYRDWSLSVFSSLKSLFPNLSLHHCKDSSLISSSDFNPHTDIFIFVGWSDLVPSEFVSRFQCLSAFNVFVPIFLATPDAPSDGQNVSQQIRAFAFEHACALFCCKQCLATLHAFGAGGCAAFIGMHARSTVVPASHFRPPHRS